MSGPGQSSQNKASPAQRHQTIRFVSSGQAGRLRPARTRPTERASFGAIDGDTYFPLINESEWILVSNTDNPADEKHIYAFSFQTWERKTN